MNEVVTDYIVIHVVALSKKKSIGLWTVNNSCSVITANLNAS